LPPCRIDPSWRQLGIVLACTLVAPWTSTAPPERDLPATRWQCCSHQVRTEHLSG
jgi:hypothetical protein